MAGVAVTVRFEPLPPKLILLVGTRAGFEELADMMRFVTGVSASPIVKGMAAVAVFSSMV